MYQYNTPTVNYMTAFQLVIITVSCSSEVQFKHWETEFKNTQMGDIDALHRYPWHHSKTKLCYNHRNQWCDLQSTDSI